MAESRFANSNRPAGEKASHSAEPGVARHEALEARTAAAKAKADLLSRRPAGPQPVQRAAAASPNRTGLPDGLKVGMESLAGVSLNDVRVHYDSPRPGALQAHAFAQGREIHLAPGQRRHLPHEAWHVVQQKQGRVRATGRTSSGVAVNDSPSLEAEADRMGRAALSTRVPPHTAAPALGTAPSLAPHVLQAEWKAKGPASYWEPPVSGVVWWSDGADYWFDIVSEAAEVYRHWAGKKKSHDEWKALGADDAPEIAPVEQTGEYAALTEIAQGVDVGSGMVCDTWAAAFQAKLIERGISFVAVKYTIRPDKNWSAIAAGVEIHFRGQQIGYDQHFFTVININGREVVFDNLNTEGIDRAEHFANLSFHQKIDKYAEAPEKELAFGEWVIITERKDAPVPDVNPKVAKAGARAGKGGPGRGGRGGGPAKGGASSSTSSSAADKKVNA